MEFDGKVAIVTGATSGIGMATVSRFAEQGARVAAVGRKREVLAKVQRQNVRTYAADLTSEQETAAFARRTLDDFGASTFSSMLPESSPTARLRIQLSPITT